MSRRDAAQALFISLRMQADLIETLLMSGALSTQQAWPHIGQIKSLASSWRREFPEGPDMLSETLQRLTSMTIFPG